MNDKPIPKSLHTVTVLVCFARYTLDEGFAEGPKDALDFAINSLGLHGRPDTHNLRAAALKQLEG